MHIWVVLIVPSKLYQKEEEDEEEGEDIWRRCVGHIGKSWKGRMGISEDENISLYM